MDEVRAVIGSPYTWFGLATAAIVGVWWWSMTPNTANLTLVIGVLSLSLGTFIYPWIGSQSVLVRLLWTAAVFCVASLAVNYTLWSATPVPTRIKSQSAEDDSASYAYMRPQQAEPPDGRVRLAIWNMSKQVLTGVRVRMFETDPDVFRPSEPVELHIGTLPAGHLEMTRLSIVPFNDKSFRMYRFEIISESVSVEQDLLFRYNERLKTLDDMTTVTHLPSKIVDGKLQILLHQDWHEWTPPPNSLAGRIFTPEPTAQQIPNVPKPMSPTPQETTKAPDNPITTSRIARGWTLHKRGDSWQMYLMLDTAPLDPATAAAVRSLQNPANLDPSFLGRVNALWADVRTRVQEPKLVENTLGVVSRQQVVEHINHSIATRPGVLIWSYEITRDGSGITPSGVPQHPIEIGLLTLENRNVVHDLDTLMDMRAKQIHAEALLKAAQD